MSYETCCSCSGRSFWEGECDWCREHPQPRPVVEDYGAYVTFTMIESTLPDVSDIGYRAGQSISHLVKV